MAAKSRKTVARAAPGLSQGLSQGLSIVVPLFNEANGLANLHARIVDVAGRLKAERELALEVVYVDDGSRDQTSSIANALPQGPLDIQVVTLSRNFGKEAALLAGLDHARLGAVLFMDGDGQHPPSLIETLVKRWLDDGYDVVYTAKAHRENEPRLRRVGVHWFYALINWGQRQKIPEDAGDFRLLSPRAHGSTSWNVWTLIGFSIEGLTSFTVAPLRVASLLGLLMATSALLFGASMLLQTLLYGGDVPGYPSLVVGLMVLGGVQLLMIGVLGEYVGKLLSEIKARPVYFVAEHSVKSAAETTKESAKSAASRAAE